MCFENLARAVQAVLYSKTFLLLLLNIDRLGNALAGGDYRATVSGRVGFFALTKPNPYWLLLQWIINETFRPVDGRYHCKRAYIFEKKKGLSHRRGNDVALGLLSIIVIVACLILAPVIWLCAKAKRAF